MTVQGQGQPARQGRVSPVHEQWLYRQSMLSQARALVQRMPARLYWRHPAYTQDAGPVRSNASVWAMASTGAAGAARTAASPSGPVTFAGLQAALPALASLGVQGVWLGDIRETDLAWLADPDAPDAAGQRTASLAPDQRFGSAEAMQALLSAMELQGLQSGMSLVPAATGLGPDFMLQARGSARQEGLYVLFDIPPQHWALLPHSKGPWDVHALSPSALAALRAAGLIPGPLLQDVLQAPQLAAAQAAVPCGYAATGSVLGLDGQTRRYVYRYHGSPLQPVLDWQHPAGQARSLLAASAIQTTGVFRQTLAGLAVSALAGLDTAATPKISSSASASRTNSSRTAVSRTIASPAVYEPALTACADLSALVHRCGGWSLALQPLSPAMAAAAQQSCDFVAAPGFAELVRDALRTEDVTALYTALTALAKEPGLSLSSCVFASPVLTAKEWEQAVRQESQDAESAGSAGRRELFARTAHLLLALPAGLPGLSFLDMGLLVQTRGGASEPSFEPSQAALLLAPALAARSRLDLGSGRLVKTLLPAKSVLATIVSLPRGGYLVTALNFSSRPVRVEVTTGSVTGTPACLTPQVAPAASSSPTSFALSLKARQAAHFVAGQGLSAHAQGTAYGQANEQ